MADAITDSLPRLIDVRPLTPYDRNARTHSADQIEQIEASIRRFGFVGVIAYAPPAALKIGHGRVAAALAMWKAGETVYGPGKRDALPVGMLPAVDVTGLDDDDLRALVIADNQLALNAGWDEAVLMGELQALVDAGFDMPVIGFDAKELERLLNPPDSGKAGWGNMAAEFLVAPFSILNAREGWWQERKRLWLGLGIKSELGRGDNALDMSAAMAGVTDPAAVEAWNAQRRKRGNARVFGQDFLEGESTNVGLSHLRQSTGEKPNPAGGDHRKPGLGGTAFDALSSHPRYYEQKTAAEKRLGRPLTNEEFERDHWRLPDSEIASGTSIFDPVLCELVYRWFAPPAGVVLDPFAGGSVRGIVAAALGRSYVGVDLRAEQIAANQLQWRSGIGAQLGADKVEPAWHVGDSGAVLPTLDCDADLIFSCPPYGDLEVYSDDPADISTMDVEAFDRAYAAIVAAALARLKPDRFAVFVVGDYRDKRGLYRNLIGKTTAAFQAAGAHLYNEAILVTSIGSLAIRAAKQFRTSRKLGKSHQNVMVYVKGDPRRATKALGAVDVSAAIELISPESIDEA